jgi:uncharacterized membrane protein
MADISVKLAFIFIGLVMLLAGAVWINLSNSVDDDDTNDEEGDNHSGLVHVGLGTYRTPESCFWQGIIFIIVGSILIVAGIFV